MCSVQYSPSAGLPNNPSWVVFNPAFFECNESSDRGRVANLIAGNASTKDKNKQTNKQHDEMNKVIEHLQ